MRVVKSGPGERENDRRAERSCELDVELALSAGRLNATESEECLAVVTSFLTSPPPPHVNSLNSLRQHLN